MANSHAEPKEAVQGMWDVHVQLGHISEDEVELIETYRYLPRKQLRDMLIDGKVVKDYVLALINVVHTFRFQATPEHIKLALRLAKELLSVETRLAVKLFEDNGGNLPYKQMLPMITKGPNSDDADKESQDLACLILAYFCSVKDPREMGYALGNCTRWINEHISKADPPGNAASAVSACAILVRSPAARQHYLKSQGPRMLSEMISHPNTPKQMLYEIVLSLWLLTFSEESFDVFISQTAIVRNVSEFCLPHAEDKIARLGLSLLRNLVGQHGSGGESFSALMVEHGVHERILDLKVRLWQERDEPEVNEDIKIILGGLNTDIGSRTSMDKFKSELAGDRLKPGPLHTEKFWREHAYEFEWKEFQMIKQLISFLSHQDPTTVALACFDLGEFTRFYEHGKGIMTTLQGKQQIMGLLAHENAEIQKAALKSSAKMLISNWQHI